LVGLAEVALALPDVARQYGSRHAVATIGHVRLHPGSANVIPGRADFSVDMRDLEPEALAELSRAMRETVAAIARRRDLMFEFQVVSEIAPVRCDADVMDTLKRAAAAFDEPVWCLPSGAAHDAQMMSHLTRIGMLFLPSRMGRSHSAAEWTDWDAIECGANVLLHGLTELAAD
jgi:N-carbamoyl-L-amino-acid hydrolase